MRWETFLKTRVFRDKVLRARVKCVKIIMHIYANEVHDAR